MTNDFKDCKNLYDFVVLIQSLEDDADKAWAVWYQARAVFGLSAHILLPDAGAKGLLI